MGDDGGPGVGGGRAGQGDGDTRIGIPANDNEIVGDYYELPGMTTQ